MERTYKVTFTIKGKSTITVDDSNYDKYADLSWLAEDLFNDLSNKELLRYLDFDTVEILTTQEVDD